MLAAMTLLVSAGAMANMIVPMVAYSGVYLFIGNIVVGVCEGAVLTLLFKIRVRESVPLMIIANYVSSWAGVFCVSLLPHERSLGSAFLALEVHYTRLDALLMSVPLANLPKLLLLIVSAFYGVTVLLEWPFVIAIIRTRTRSPFKWPLGILLPSCALKGGVLEAFLASVVVNWLSYCAIVLMCLHMGNFSLVKETLQEPSLAFVKNRNAEVFFVAPDGKSVERMKLDGTGRTRVGEFPESWSSRNKWMKLQRADCPGCWNLSCDGPWDRAGRMYKDIAILGKDLPLGDLVEGSRAEFSRVGSYGALFYPTEDFRPESEREWSFGNLLYQGVQIKAINGVTQESFELSLITPAYQWDVRADGVLPGDEVVLEVQARAIYVFDRKTRKIALLARGSNAIVAVPR